jgi:hypothetical protein
MSWESVKGFCRRQTQSFKESFRHANKTEDPECDQMIENTQKISAQVQRMGIRLKNFSQEVMNIVLQFESTRDDLSDCADAEVSSNCKKIDLAANDLRQKYLNLDKRFQEQITQISKFVADSAQFAALVEDRKSKMLEFDFFRNKVADLRADPPADSSRIPRNEGRVSEWKAAYEESTSRLKRFCSVTIENGTRLLVFGTQGLMNESGQFFFEASKTTRAVFIGASLSDQASKALEVARSTATAAVTASANQAASIAQQATAPPVSNKRFVSDDDPFRL